MRAKARASLHTAIWAATSSTDVTGGLINIITRQPGANTPLRPEFETFWGGPSTWRTGARLAFGGDTYALRLGATQTATGNAHNAFGGVIPNQQDYQNYQARLDLLPNADNRIALKYSGFRFHSGLLAISLVRNDSAVTPKAGLSWNFAPGLRVRANYSQCFRVPTVKERFFRGFAGPLNAEIEDLDLGGVRCRRSSRCGVTPT